MARPLTHLRQLCSDTCVNWRVKTLVCVKGYSDTCVKDPRKAFNDAGSARQLCSDPLGPCVNCALTPFTLGPRPLHPTKIPLTPLASPREPLRVAHKVRHRRKDHG